MFRTRPPRLLASFPRSVLVAVLAYSLGAATLASAGPVVSGFVGLIDGANTAAINASRELSVTDVGTQGALTTVGSTLAAANAHLANVDAATAKLAFDAAGNLRTSPQGTVSVAGNVSVTNFPTTQDVSGTVGISSAANTVKIDPANNGERTSVVLTLADLGGTLVPSSGITRFLDVGAFERVRLLVGNICTSAGSVTVFVRANDGVGWLYDQFTVASCSEQDRTYQLPGTRIAIQVSPPTASPTRIFLQLFGR